MSVGRSRRLSSAVCWRWRAMRIGLNWFEVTLSATQMKVPVENVATTGGAPPRTPDAPHRIVQRRRQSSVRFLHLTDRPPSGVTEETLNVHDDPSFIKFAVEEGFADLLREKRFTVCRKHVGGTAYIFTSESLWPETYSFLRGLSFRGFYGFGPRADRWGLVLNYATSQRFKLTLEDARLQRMAL